MLVTGEVNQCTSATQGRSPYLFCGLKSSGELLNNTDPWVLLKINYWEFQEDEAPSTNTVSTPPRLVKGQPELKLTGTQSNGENRGLALYHSPYIENDKMPLENKGYCFSKVEGPLLRMQTNLPER